MKDWVLAAVGCYWSCGTYSISTYRAKGNAGYSLWYIHKEIGEYPTLTEAKQAAEDHQIKADNRL